MIRIKLTRDSWIKKTVIKVIRFLKGQTDMPWWKRNYKRYLWNRRILMSNKADELKLYNQEWHRKHAKEVSERKRKWYLEHQDEVREYQRVWRAKNPDKVRVAWQKAWLKRKDTAKDKEDIPALD